MISVGIDYYSTSLVSNRGVRLQIDNRQKT